MAPTYPYRWLYTTSLTGSWGGEKKIVGYVFNNTKLLGATGAIVGHWEDLPGIENKGYLSFNLSLDIEPVGMGMAVVDLHVEFLPDRGKQIYPFRGTGNVDVSTIGKLKTLYKSSFYYLQNPDYVVDKYFAGFRFIGSYNVLSYGRDPVLQFDYDLKEAGSSGEQIRIIFSLMFLAQRSVGTFELDGELLWLFDNAMNTGTLEDDTETYDDFAMV